MKKLNTILIALLFSFSLSAEEFLNETFDTWLPEGWTVIEGPGTWANSHWWHNENRACVFVTGDNQDEWLITPEITLPESGELRISVDMMGSFYRMVTMDWGDIFVNVSTDNGANWETIWVEDDQEIVEASGVEWPWLHNTWFYPSININQFAGQTIKIAFRYVSPDGDADWWNLDNIVVKRLVENEVVLEEFEFPEYGVINDEFSFEGSFRNLGENDVTSFEAVYTINEIESEVLLVENVVIPYNTTYDFAHNIPYTFTEAEIFDISLKITKVNGGDDPVPENNVIFRDITIASEVVSRIPLFEVFTSSTCGACPGSNSTIDGVLQANPSNTYSLVKYQVSWPGSGDPYCIDACGERVSFYGVDGVPDFYSNGNYTSGSSFTQAKFNQAVNEDAYVELNLEYSFDGLNVDANIVVDPKINIADASAYFAVVEKTTYNNVGTNGETEFHNVLMAMMPGGNGISTSFTNGITSTFSGSANLITTFIEEFDDLMIVAWVQDNETKSVLQSESYDLTLSGNENQTIAVEPGFQFVSSRIDPEDPDMMAVVNEILNDDFEYIRNSQGSMLRKIGPNWVNGIGDWIGTEGYLIKTNATGQFIVEGSLIPVDTPIDVVIGFQFISYLPDNEMDALDAFSSIIGDNLSYVRSSDGSMLRKIGPNWVNGIGNCLPSEGYLVKMSSDAVLIYPAEGKSANLNKIKPSHFQSDGGNAADPVYTIYVEGLEIGDEIAVFDANKMVGASVIISKNVLDNSIPVFSTLNEGEGFKSDNPVSIVVWDAQNQTEVSANYTFINEYANNYTNTTFPSIDGEFSIINVTKASNGLNSELEISLYPNPASDLLNIISNYNIKRIKVLNFVGQIILNNDINETTLIINTSTYKAGIYIFQIETDKGIITQKVSIN